MYATPALRASPATTRPLPGHCRARPTRHLLTARPLTPTGRGNCGRCVGRAGSRRVQQVMVHEFGGRVVAARAVTD